LRRRCVVPKAARRSEARWTQNKREVVALEPSALVAGCPRGPTASPLDCTPTRRSQNIRCQRTTAALPHRRDPHRQNEQRDPEAPWRARIGWLRHARTRGDQRLVPTRKGQTEPRAQKTRSDRSIGNNNCGKWIGSVAKTIEDTTSLE